MNYDVNRALEGALEEAKKLLGTGTMPDFIPALEHLDPTKLGVSITDMEGSTHSVGCGDLRFSIQSISKIIMLELALRDVGEEEVFSRVGVEPSGTAFNSVFRLELMETVPANPLINPGAIAMASCVKGADLEEKYERLRALAADLLGNPELTYSPEVVDCEMKTGHRNRALASLMLHNGVFTGDPEEYLELYYRGCALMASTAELSRFGAILANDGILPGTSERLLSREHCQLFRGLMATCGMYDSTGAYAIRVGIPAKSGSGGGILAAARGKAGLAVYGPELDGRGNSVCGMQALAYLSEALDLRAY